ncbi:macro domain-containing protein [Cohnella silvisoli]|uniref:Macro domain-containing protein n=1 Tax=Cohnella silvisoli TaxID=2873699 RepID=A0ABV1L1G1_9BACL|nr:macro domain-containing protein [Cohnella silvisoli]MCD9025449.1 macro domain-containing protein [Cohnella silvisoli]
MELIEIKKDLFTMPEDYFLAHCISADAKMGAGIAVQFRKKFKLSSLQDMASRNDLIVGKSYKVDRVFNLITKSKYWYKPTYETLTMSLKSMKEICVQESINKLAMPEIGCGLDKLQWGRVKEIIINEFIDTPIEITVCRL